MQYIIKGDTEKHKDCLVCVCGSDLDLANKALDRMINNPTDNELRLKDGHVNLRLELVEDKNCWWNNDNI